MCAKHNDGRNPDSGNTARGDDAQSQDDKTVETNTSSKSDPELIRGKVLGDKYEILSHLGSGAMGAVYKARHQILNKDVAVKVLQSEALNDRVKKERFLREAKAQGGLTHRNIAAVHDFGLTEKDQPFFVMDFLEGQTLEELLEKEKSLDCRQFIAIFEQVARGLQHAHSKGIIHRDLKPSNIMLIDSEEGEMQALLVDFGIAVHSKEELTKLTKAGYIVGTPHYMSPEQIEGKTLDARSDIYSLGCVMFETLTGNVPFLGMNAPATMALHLAQPPEHITSFSTKTPLPEGLADLVMKCIEKRPENRFGTAKEIAAHLNDFKTAVERGLKDKDKEKSEKISEAGDNLAVVGKDHHQKNPAHAPALDETVLPQPQVEEKTKPADKIELKADASNSSTSITKGDTNPGAGTNAEDSGHQSQLLDESGRLRMQVEDNKIARDGKQSDSLDSLEPKSNDAKSPDAQGYNEVYNKFVANLQKQEKEPLDFRVYGHDVIRWVVIIFTGLIFLPINNHLVLQVNLNQLRDDNFFFQLVKFLIETYNHFASHVGWQWILWFGIIVFIDSILRRLLKSAPNE